MEDVADGRTEPAGYLRTAESAGSSPRGVFYYWKGEVNRPGILMRRTPSGDLPIPNMPEGINCRTDLSPKGSYLRAGSKPRCLPL
jgi:hypothetical protein